MVGRAKLGAADFNLGVISEEVGEAGADTLDQHEAPLMKSAASDDQGTILDHGPRCLVQCCPTHLAQPLVAAGGDPLLDDPGPQNLVADTGGDPGNR